VDYTALSQKVTFVLHQTRAAFVILIKDDTTPQEPDIFFSVAIIYNGNTIASSFVTIIDEDHGEFKNWKSSKCTYICSYTNITIK